jgi:hypothetical protein
MSSPFSLYPPITGPSHYKVSGPSRGRVGAVITQWDDSAVNGIDRELDTPCFGTEHDNKAPALYSRTHAPWHEPFHSINNTKNISRDFAKLKS